MPNYDDWVDYAKPQDANQKLSQWLSQHQNTKVDRIENAPSDSRWLIYYPAPQLPPQP